MVSCLSYLRSCSVWAHLTPVRLNRWISRRVGVVCCPLTVNPEYFVRTQFSYPGLSDLSYAWNFRTVAERCGLSDLLCTFRMYFIFVRKPPRTKHTKITCIRSILDLQYLAIGWLTSKPTAQRRLSFESYYFKRGRVDCHKFCKSHRLHKHLHISYSSGPESLRL